MEAQPWRARAGGPHVVKEGPFREVPLTAMGGGLREHGKIKNHPLVTVTGGFRRIYIVYSIM